MHKYVLGMSTLTLDPGARTIQFEHFGLGGRQANSPWIVSAGAIETIEREPKKFMVPGSFRFVLLDRSGYHPDMTSDMSGVEVKRNEGQVDELLDRVERMMDGAPRSDGPVLNSPLTAKVTPRPGLDVFGGIAVDEHAIYCEGVACRIEGAQAELVDANAARSRVTATRVAAGAVIAGPVGALIGGMAKKSTGQAYVVVTAADGRVLSASGKGKELGKAAEIVSKINARS